MRNILIFFFIGLISNIQAQNSILQSGPMLGPITLRDATIWVQAKQVSYVQIEYRAKNSADKFIESAPTMADAQNNFIVSIHLHDLIPGTNYEYKVKLKNEYLQLPYPLEFKTQEQWQFRKDAPDFTFVAGSCFYINDTAYDRPGKPYGGEYEIIKHITNSKPDLMIWLGDNTYLREGDFESRSGIYYRNTHTRSLAELQPLLAATPHYAIWDDHDYGTNDSDWTYPLKHHALDAFKQFWPSESYGAGHTEGVTSSFGWNDCQFFMLDNRWYRTVQTEDGTILGDMQKYWFKEALLASKATFKFVAVGGQFLSDYAAFENFANYKAEREELIQFIDDNNIKNVIFLTGDRHHSEISKLITSKGNIIYDVTSSAITSTTYDHSKEPNSHRVEGSMISERNFAIFNVTGERKNRKLSVVFKNTQGKEVYNYSFE
ncbi:MAG: alkaline phosphatase family protein [Saprospiraceae bacterium]|nr:alkaline phosphatase family protein [Saprospiraceae bacterium]